jgi:hypothetical protein
VEEAGSPAFILSAIDAMILLPRQGEGNVTVERIQHQAGSVTANGALATVLADNTAQLGIQARFQESEMGHGQVCDQSLPRRLLGRPGLELVCRRVM